MAPAPLSLRRVYRARPGWYSGDFHCHTNHSDGDLTPRALLDLARAEGLDFFAITDHNRTSSYGCFGAPATRSDICIIPGMEVTSQRGHFNIYGIETHTPWLAWLCVQELTLERESVGRTLNDLVRLSAADGLLPSLNHPLLVPWAWEEALTPLADVSCVEIWNGPAWPDNRIANPAAVALWTEWLNAGYRITALGGSDFHRPHGIVERPDLSDRLGEPRTYVYAERLSGAAILSAVRRRSVYVSMGPQVTFHAEHNSRHYGIGADLGQISGPVTLRATGSAVPTAGCARLVQNGATLAKTAVDDTSFSLQGTLEANPARADWVRLDLFTPDGQLLAITNPIFAGPRRALPSLSYGELLPHAQAR